MSTITADLPTQVTLNAAERAILGDQLVMLMPELQADAPLGQLRTTIDSLERIYRLRHMLQAVSGGDVSIGDVGVIGQLRDIVVSNATDALAGEEAHQDRATAKTWHALEDKLQVDRRALAFTGGLR
ncbi:hypothetical protein [Patulibacter sp. SYSU D01012]|uniref:hypothetical protein n=1 Tax=Patulibacter sp. SYSU D01012 TaxID=2817381 RepID=UPI001B305A7A|nr:hypothetical protein [Patulibacter sp. SYSU D01012]